MATSVFAQDDPASGTLDETTDQETDVEIDFFVIGFDVNTSTAAQLQAVAEAAGGNYVDAQGGDELEAAFGQGLGVATGAFLNAEVEPNNTFGSANLTGANHILDATILTAGDRDWFAFEVAHHGELLISITNVAADLAVDVRIWTANKETLTDWFRPLAAGGDTTAVVDLPGPGRYLLEIAADSGQQASAEPFSVGLSFTPSADQGEPNNNFGAAAPLSIGQALSVTLLPAGDRDWYRLTVDHHGELRLAATNVASDLAVNVRVWTANKETLTDWFAPLAVGGDTTAVVDLPAPGDYFLELAGGDSRQRSISSFTLAVDFTASADQSEPNPNFGSAMPLALGQPVQATILPAGERDWYTLDIDHHGELRLIITDVPDTLAVDVRVWTANKETLTDWYRPLAVGGDTVAIVDLPAPGRYFVELAADQGGQRDIQPFTLEPRFTPAADAFEPNPTFGQAAALTLDSAVPLNLLPAGERDWFVIDVPHHGQLELSATQVPVDLAVAIRVWNANKETLTDWYRPLAAGGDTEALVDIPQPGRYYIEIAGNESRQRSIDAFLFTNRYRAAADQGEPNNTLETATPVNLDETIPANILPAGDRDWCLFEVTEAGELHILVVNGSPDLTIQFRVWDDQKRTLTDWFRPLSQGGNVEAVVPIDEPGNYYLEVIDNSSSARSIEPYSLRFSMEPIDPSDLVEEATGGDTVSAVVDDVTAEILAPQPDDERTVTPVGATLEGVRVQVPANALPADAEILLEVGLITNFADLPIADVTHPDLGQVAVEYQLVPVGPVVSLQPNGLTFTAPVRVEIPIDPEAVAPEALGYWVLLGSEAADGSWLWELLPEEAVEVDQANGMVNIQVDHFSGAAPVAVVDPAATTQPTSTTARAATPDEVTMLKNMVGRFLARYQQADACFAGAVSLGDSDRYRAVLDQVAVVIDPDQAGSRQGEMSADGSTLTLVIAPTDVDPAQRYTYEKTLWHELTHRLEIDRWDRWHWSVFSPFGHYDSYKERNAEYMEHAESVLGMIAQFEQLAGQPNVTESQLRNRWQLIQTRLAAGSINDYDATPDLARLESWTGFAVNLGDVEALYRSGACGPTLAALFDDGEGGSTIGATAGDSDQTALGGDEPYAVFLAANNEILVGRRSELEAIPSCHLRGWGIDCTKTVAQVTTLNQIMGPFASKAEASAAYCADLVPGSRRKPPLVVSTVGTMNFDGQEHWISNAPRCE